MNNLIAAFGIGLAAAVIDVIPIMIQIFSVVPGADVGLAGSVLISF
jgi:hypothetical protein